MNHTPAQLQAINSDAKAMLVIAGAGSGKTATTIARIARLVSEGTNPASILCLTFTRKAANEVKERLAKKIGTSAAKKIWAGTFHSISYRILMQWGSKIGYQTNSGRVITVVTPEESEELIKQIMIAYDYKGTAKSLNDAKSILAHDGTEPEDLNIKRIIAEYHARLKECNTVDFDQLLLEVQKLFEVSQDALDFYRTKFQHIFVDEYQDTDKVQYNLHEVLAPKHLFCVGDTDQCQPAGTMVSVSAGRGKRGSVAIEELNPLEHKLVSFDSHSSCVVGLQDGYSFDVASRDYNGKMFTVSAGGKQTRCTPNHKWLVRWSKKSTSLNAVYLMKSGDMWRIGWCQLFQNDGNFHLSQRARIEKAEGAWILKIVDNKKDAYMWETILAAKYGIPQIPFVPAHGAQHITSECIRGVFDELVDTDFGARARRALEDHNRHIDHPIWVSGEKTARGVRRKHVVHACNLLPECMEIPSFDGSRDAQWNSFSLSTHDFSGRVYSLQVEKHELYIADDLITHNCIYGWRGSDIGIILNFETDHPGAEVIKLEHCFRCADSIVDHANSLIENNQNRIEKTLIGATGKDGVFESSAAKAEDLAFYIAENMAFLNPGEIAVIARTHRTLEQIERACKQLNLDVLRVGKATAEIEQDDSFKFMTAMLRLQLNPRDNMAFLTANKIGFREDLKEIWKHANLFGCSWYEASGAMSFIVTPEQALVEFYRECCELLDCNYSQTVIDYLQANWPEITADDFLEQYQLKDSHLELEKKRPDTITLITGHASKGLEWDNVLIADFNEQAFPSKMALREGNLEEERRLAYVAFTRARNLLLVFHDPEKVPSRFIAESQPVMAQDLAA